MGIVVTVFMVLGLLHQSPVSFLSLGGFTKKKPLTMFIGISLLSMGLWNSLWFGLGNLSYFWGQAALFSGVFMVMTALIILISSYSLLSSSALLQKLADMIQLLLPLWLLGLLASALLYAVTLVRLNLGLPIIG